MGRVAVPFVILLGRQTFTCSSSVKHHCKSGSLVWSLLIIGLSSPLFLICTGRIFLVERTVGISTLIIYCCLLVYLNMAKWIYIQKFPKTHLIHSATHRGSPEISGHIGPLFSGSLKRQFFSPCIIFLFVSRSAQPLRHQYCFNLVFLHRSKTPGLTMGLSKLSELSMCLSVWIDRKSVV